MTSVFYGYFVAREWLRRTALWLEDKWWDFADGFTNRHQGADESYAAELHHQVEMLEASADHGLDFEGAELAQALMVMEKSTLLDFNTAVDAAIAEFVSKGELVKVTDTGEIMMNKLNMELWRQKQVDKIRSLASEFAEACRQS